MSCARQLNVILFKQSKHELHMSKLFNLLHWVTASLGADFRVILNANF